MTEPVADPPAPAAPTADASTPVAAETSASAPVTSDDVWQIEVDHSSHFRWMPVVEAEVAAGDITIDSTWPGFRMRRVTVPESTTSTTGVRVQGLLDENNDRAAAGLPPKALSALLTRHLEDGPWPKHFPLDSITAIRCTEPAIEARLRSYFLDTA